MKISFFNRSYWPDAGATGQLLTELAEDLARVYGCEVEVVAGPPLGGSKRATAWGLSQVEHHNGVRILRAAGTHVSPRRFVGRAANYLTYFLSACWAGLRSHHADIVVALTDPPIIGLAALLAARRAGARFVFLSEDVFPEVAVLLEDFRSEHVNRMLDRVNRSLLRRADRIVALGETMRERLVAKGADPLKIVVIHNWADCELIVPDPKRNPFAVDHDLADKFVVMHSGNVGFGQGLETLVDAAVRLAPHKDIVIAIVGDGTSRAALERRVQQLGLSNVRFLPHQPRSGLRWSFGAADLFVISMRAGLAGYIVPSKLYGILAAGRPYVACVDEASEVAAITRRHACGLVVRPADSAALADAILALYRDNDVRTEMATRARAAALQFDRRKQVKAYYDLFASLIAPPAEEPAVEARV